MHYRRAVATLPDFRHPEQRPCPAVDTRVANKLGPGAPGTLGLVERYGETLVCVRYREHADGRRFTTVELVVEERRREPKTALVRIAYGETELRRKAREVGGEWLPDREVWRFSKGAIQALGITGRVVPGNG